MPRNFMTKDEVKVRVLKLKNELYNGTNHDKNGDWHQGAHTALNRVLDILEEYRY